MIRKWGLLLFFPLVLGTGAEPTLAEKYYALQEGMRWQYLETVVDFSFATTTRVFAIEALPPRLLRDKTLVPLRAAEGFILFSGEDEQGFFEYARQRADAPHPEIRAAPNYFLKHPIAAGTTWELEIPTVVGERSVDIAVTATIEAVDDEVKVPAGTFSRCVRVKFFGKESFQLDEGTTVMVTIVGNSWIAPGVGDVRYTFRQTTDNAQIGGIGYYMSELLHFQK